MLQFLTERMSLARYCHQDQLDLFNVLFSEVLSTRIGTGKPPSVVPASSTRTSEGVQLSYYQVTRHHCSDAQSPHRGGRRALSAALGGA